MATGSRLPAFLLLAFVVIAAVLLVAGWGVVVGVGVFVGLVLGLVAIFAFMAIAQRAGGSTSFSILKSASTSIQPDHVMLERQGRDSMRVAGIDAGALRRVVAVGDAVEAGGVRLELTAIEMREDGGLAKLVAHTRPPMGPAGHFVEVRVSDDAETAYVAAGQGMGGPTPTATRHEIRFAPSPPHTARVLTLRVERFIDPFPGRATPIEGPWTFEVRLAS